MRKLTQKEVGEFFDVTPRTVRDWDKAGCPSKPEGKSKVYTSSEVHAWLTARAVADAEGSIGVDVNDDDIKEAAKLKLLASSEKEQAAAAMAQLEYGRRLGDLIPVEFAEGLLSDLIAEFNQAIEVVPVRFANELAACKTLADFKRVLERMMGELRACLVRIDLRKNKNDRDSAEDPSGLQEQIPPVAD